MPPQDFEEFDIWDGSHERRTETFFGRLREAIAVTFKHHGKWRVHQNDPDKIFPSDFHADRVDKGEKLDLYTGDVYSVQTNEKVYRISDKHMNRIYDQLSDRNRDFLNNRLQHVEKFEYRADN